MARAVGEREENRRVRLAAAAQMLDAVSYHGVLERGFALVRGRIRTGRCAGRPRSTPPSGSEVEFSDGVVAAVAEGRAAPSGVSNRAAPDAAPARPKRAQPRDGSEGQGTLF